MRARIWTLPTRIFHWLLAIGFATAYIVSDFEDLNRFHFAFGAFAGSLAFFRILFGFFGPKYSHFRDFPVGIKKLRNFFKNITDKTKTYIGHNPAAAAVMLGILVTAVLCNISGYLFYGAKSHAFDIGINRRTLKEIHEIFANLFLIMVAFHFLGIIVDNFLHRKIGAITSIFNGYKNVEAENIRLNRFQKIFSILWFILPLIIFWVAYNL